MFSPPLYHQIASSSKSLLLDEKAPAYSVGDHKRVVTALAARRHRTLAEAFPNDTPLHEPWNQAHISQQDWSDFLLHFNQSLALSPSDNAKLAAIRNWSVPVTSSWLVGRAQKSVYRHKMNAAQQAIEDFNHSTLRAAGYELLLFDANSRKRSKDFSLTHGYHGDWQLRISPLKLD